MYDTIFAISTPSGKSGVAIIRVSGPHVPNIMTSLAGDPLPENRYATLRALHAPWTGELIDQALVLYFKGPHSFTGEEVCEFQIHGSKAVKEHLLEVLGTFDNTRMAEPGEFTRRAFLNGVMDLTQVEGLSDLIESETRVQQQVALRQMKGELHDLYQTWRQQLIDIMARLEAFIDFPDDDLPEDLVADMEEQLISMTHALHNHTQDGRRGERLREGLYVAIIGAPNVGKSSLLNYLAQRDVAIVSHRAGTTRDVIEIHLDIGGYPIILADTAGLRETSDEIEVEGIRRARERVDMADYTIALFDATKSELDEETWKLVNDRTLCVINKIDLCNAVPDTVLGKKMIPVSVKEKNGLDILMKELKKKAEELLMPTQNPMITRERHRQALVRCLEALKQVHFDKPIELVGEDLRYASQQLGIIIGKIGVEEILDELFSKFCIGK